MIKQHRDILRRMRPEFVNDLQNLEDILDNLEASSIITLNQRCKILAASTPQGKIRELLDTVQRCGPHAYEGFKKALLSTKQQFLWDAMLANEDPISNINNDHSTVTQFTLPSKSDSNIYLQPNILTKNNLDTHSLQHYVVQSSPRGYVLIINIEEFDSKCKVSNRPGSQKDVEALTLLFEEFEYSVCVLKNLTHDKLIDNIRTFAAKSEHKAVDAGGLIVMTHGLRDHLYASDGQLVKLEDIIHLFCNEQCWGLQGKPKFVIFQACRGDTTDTGAFVADSAKEVVPNLPTVQKGIDDVDSCNKRLLPYMSDCIIVYSTLPGFVSWRSEENGSWFIQILVDVFRRLGKKLAVFDLLTEVNRILVDEGKDRGYKQIATPSSTLTKRFFLSTK